MLGCDIVDADREMAISIAQVVGLGPALVHRQLKL